MARTSLEAITLLSWIYLYNELRHKLILSLLCRSWYLGSNPT